MRATVYCKCNPFSESGTFCREIAVEGDFSLYECEHCYKQYIIAQMGDKVGRQK